MITDSRRIHITDKHINGPLSTEDFSNHLMLRVSAKGQTFRSVDFRYTIFDTCYFRKCVFDGCNFTGCRFVGTNLNGASFFGCIFDYVTFERTIIDPHVLDNCCPGHDNLKERFARTLRMNFQQLGDAVSANLAISVELDATESKLYKSWASNESYYRNHYKGFDRIISLVRYIEFKLLDIIWGNGESLFKLFRATGVFLFAIAVNDAIVRYNPIDLRSYYLAATAAPQIFLGTLSPTQYQNGFLTAIQVVRLISIGFFMSIIIKRFNRR